MVASLAAQNGQQVLEIGPGRGALTDALLAQQMRRKFSLCAVELDRDLAQYLRQKYAHQPLRIIQADILSLDLTQISPPDRPSESRPWRIIGNLPYNISTPLLFHLLRQLPQIHDMLFMFQRELGLRLAAATGSRHYGRLSVSAGLRLRSEILFDVPPEAFDPPPKVRSAVLRLQPQPPPIPLRCETTFHALVKAAFSQRRKTLRNALRAAPQLGLSDAQFRAAEINPELRAEALSVTQYVALANAVKGVGIPEG